MKRILVAGIGNIFQGDDAFGVEVAQRLLKRSQPEGVRIVDFGIRSFDLAYALADGYDAVILVDAVQRGNPPGTLYLIEPEQIAAAPLETSLLADAHSMTPVRAMEMARALGGASLQLYLVACEPAILETDELGLSCAVEAAIPGALDMIESLTRDLLLRPASEVTAYER